jgi:hypothetical protein
MYKPLVGIEPTTSSVVSRALYPMSYKGLLVKLKTFEILEISLRQS